MAAPGGDFRFVARRDRHGLEHRPPASVGLHCRPRLAAVLDRRPVARAIARRLAPVGNVPSVMRLLRVVDQRDFQSLSLKGSPMSLRSEIREALLASPNKTAAQLVDLCKSAGDANAMAGNLYALKKEGKIKIAGSIEGRNGYAIDDWPESSMRGTGKRAKAAPPPRAAKSKKKKYKTRRARAAEPASPAPLPRNGAASFAITDNGTLALIKHDTPLDLEPAEFTPLRTFIERPTQPPHPTTSTPKTD